MNSTLGYPGKQCLLRRTQWPRRRSHAHRAHLVFGLGIPMEVEVSTIVGYVMKCNYNLPYNASYLSEPYVRYQRSTAAADAIDDDEAHSETGRALGRYEIYKMLQSAKPCLLRAICELAATPLNASRGLTAELMHIFLTPSTTTEAYADPADQEYLAAERIGRLGDSCTRAFPECPVNLLDYVSRLE
ncbi:uncharacterized protein LOC100679123 isoform X2 [Nasonia vitripennis]|uniref:Uncharacterized protein n=1 Tax=Nasonia vitripennis TaxID=7425 RepID=A0A7M7PUE3_NASVI|nr:uncharacterized protein LOC100679123 isoform X2 [Nasonia vitripennis]